MPTPEDYEKIKTLLEVSGNSVLRLDAYRGVLFPIQVEKEALRAIRDFSKRIGPEGGFWNDLFSQDKDSAKTPFRYSSIREETFLERHGLVGSQLDFKIATIKTMQFNLDTNFSLGRLKRLIRAIRIPLESLAQGTPFLGFCKEFFDLIENWIDERINKD